MAYSRYPISADAQKIIDNTDLSAVERNYAMAILSGAFTMLDFAECVKIARKLGIGDEVMKYFAQGRKFRLSVDETEELVRKVKSAIDDIPVKTVNVDSVSQKYLENLNKKSINKLTRREDGYEILKKYEAYFGDNVEFVNELIENTPGKEIYVDPVKLLAKNAENEPNFYKFCQKIKTNCPTTEQWVKCQIDCYNSLSKDSRLRINAQPIISARYLKSDGSIDWPKFMGMKPETIKGISPDNNLPTNLSRKGVTDFGNTFGDNPQYLFS